MTTMLKAADIAAMLQVAPRVVAEKYAMRPDFPKPYRLPSAKGQGHNRWKKEDIEAWIEGLRERANG